MSSSTDVVDYNLVAGLIALGVIVVGSLWHGAIHGRRGTKPEGDWLSWIVHTRLGLAPRNWLARRLELGVVLDATVGEFFILSTYVSFLLVRLAYYLELLQGHPSTAARVGKAIGQLTPPMIFMEYLLAQRYTLWGWLSGIPHDRLIAYHRVHGWWLYALMAAHVVCQIVAVQVRVDTSAGVSTPVVRLLTDALSLNEVNPALGVAAFILWSVVAFGSFEYFRRRWWGKWYLSHFSFVPALVLSLFHARVAMLPWVIASLLCFYIDAGTRGWMKFMRRTTVVAAEVLRGSEAHVVKLTLSTGKSMAYKPGQYVWIAVGGAHLHALAGFAFHPITISSAYKQGDSSYTLHIKSQGEGTWSEALLKTVEAKGKEGLPVVRIGGPAGRLSIWPGHVQRVVLISGGIGVTPNMAILCAIVNEASSQSARKPAVASVVSPAVLSSSEPQATADADREFSGVREVTFIWTVRHTDSLKWFENELRAACAANGVAGIKVNVLLYITGKGGMADMNESGLSKALSGAHIRAGRPDIAELLSQASASTSGTGAIGVYVCGPAAMIDGTDSAVRASNKGAGGRNNKMILHAETFEW